MKPMSKKEYKIATRLNSWFKLNPHWDGDGAEVNFELNGYHATIAMKPSKLGTNGITLSMLNDFKERFEYTDIESHITYTISCIEFGYADRKVLVHVFLDPPTSQRIVHQRAEAVPPIQDLSRE